MDALERFLKHKKRIYGIAYRMTGSLFDADDIVQETYLRWSRTDISLVKSDEAFLTTIAVRISLDRLRRIKRKREVEYTGVWLPDPLPPDRQTDSERDLDLAFLHMLERLNPVERAVFLLRETFDMDYGFIASCVGKTPAACRKILSRARVALRERPRFAVEKEKQSTILSRFLLASRLGRPELLISFLQEEIEVWSDGGGKVHAARRVVTGRRRVARFLNKLRRKREFARDMNYYFMRQNGGVTIIGYRRNQPVFLQHYIFSGGVASRIYNHLNPDRLALYEPDRTGFMKMKKLNLLRLLWMGLGAW